MLLFACDALKIQLSDFDVADGNIYDSIQKYMSITSNEGEVMATLYFIWEAPISNPKKRTIVRSDVYLH